MGSSPTKGTEQKSQKSLFIFRRFFVFIVTLGIILPIGFTIKNFLDQNAVTPTTTDIPNISLYYSYHIPSKLDESLGPFTENNDHPLLRGAIVNAKWSSVQPEPGVFDWSLLDAKIQRWTEGTDKTIIIKISAYDQDPIKNGDAEDDNRTTPTWVYDSAPRITFQGGQKKEVSVPKVWDEHFYPLYEEFIETLGEHYNNDPRVAGFILGLGQSGTALAQGSRGGGEAFEAAGWTLPLWEAHSQRIIDMGTKHLRKELFVIKTNAFLNKYNMIDHPESAKRIFGYAARSGVSILMRGVTLDAEEWNTSFIPELVQYLAELDVPEGFRIGLFDDFPMWVPPERSEKCPGPTCGRNVYGFEQELSFIRATWESIDRKYPLIVIFQQPEATATNVSVPSCTEEGDLNECFYRPVYNLTQKYLIDLSPITASNK